MGKYKVHWDAILFHILSLQSISLQDNVQPDNSNAVRDNAVATVNDSCIIFELQYVTGVYTSIH